MWILWLAREWRKTGVTGTIVARHTSTWCLHAYAVSLCFKTLLDLIAKHSTLKQICRSQHVLHGATVFFRKKDTHQWKVSAVSRCYNDRRDAVQVIGWFIFFFYASHACFRCDWVVETCNAWPRHVRCVGTALDTCSRVLHLCWGRNSSAESCQHLTPCLIQVAGMLMDREGIGMLPFGRLFISQWLLSHDSVCMYLALTFTRSPCLQLTSLLVKCGMRCSYQHLSRSLAVVLLQDAATHIN